MKNHEIKRKALQVVEKVARNEAGISIISWPPECMGIYHQPKRPKRK
jgi:cyclic lactone autoinducer peptide